MYITLTNYINIISELSTMILTSSIMISQKSFYADNVNPSLARRLMKITFVKMDNGDNHRNDIIKIKNRFENS